MTSTQDTERNEGNKIVSMSDLSLGDRKAQEKAGEQPLEDGIDGIIDLSVTRKKRFHVNRGTASPGVLELDTSDMNIITRLNQLYPRLERLSQDAAIKQLSKKDADDEILTKISEALQVIDKEMRQILDEIFDSNVSEVCAPSGSMMDPFNGEFRFEHIIDVISKLYSNNLNEEYRKTSAKMKARTDKYTKGR